MIASLNVENHKVQVDLAKPLDISIPLQGSSRNPEAWYLTPPTIKPVVLDDWVAKVSEGASINFNTIVFNPHAHGTHTECVGHITEDFHSVNKALDTFFFMAEVITVAPESKKDDLVISAKQIKSLLEGKTPQAIIIRTLPNLASKKTQKYSNTNWPYLEQKAAAYLRDIGVQHLLIDLPSVDREKDEGRLAAHRAFWNHPENTRFKATITEFIFVSNRIKDGSYLLNLQIAPFHNDATPSKPILYKILEEKEVNSK